MNRQALQQADAYVSVVICTRNRGTQIISTLQSILRNRYPSFELLVIDQSTNDETATALAEFLPDGRVRYIHSATTGLGLSRNLSLTLAKGELILMTDDDCEVAEDWIAQMVAMHHAFPQAAIVFCDVLPGPFHRDRGFIPNSIVQHDLLITSLREWCLAGAANIGVGAGISIRRSIASELGGFDTRLGAGTPLHSAEETDLAVRALLHNYHVYRTITTYVIHYGFRNFVDGRSLMRGYMFGIAAFYSKLIRCGYLQLLPVVAYEFWRTVLQPGLQSLLKFNVPPVAGRTLYLLRGFQTAWKIGIDKRHEVFQPLNAANPVDAPLLARDVGHEIEGAKLKINRDFDC